jgi:predicted RNA binding protein YcfA (HicA-like mRNA interferase family)
MTSSEVIRRLKDDGWVLNRIKGSHHIYVHVSKAGHITVPHPKKDLGLGLIKKLMKQANIKE